jgi:hypothetical protein
VIRGFVDGLLSSSILSGDVLKLYGNVIPDLGIYAVPILHQAVREVNVNIVRFLFDSVQAAGHTDSVSEMLLTEEKLRNYERKTTRHLALRSHNIQI